MVVFTIDAITTTTTTVRINKFILKYMKQRKLVTVRKISNLSPIEGADRIELASVDGWNVVVEKGLHEVGNYIFYFEIDSFIPNELAPFLSKGKEPREYNGVKGEKLRTIRLKGQLSQGLILPMFAVFKENFTKILEAFLENSKDSLLASYVRTPDSKLFHAELSNSNLDFASLLDIQKYEKPLPACLQNTAKGNFPSFIRRTDQERIQNLWDKYKEKYNDVPFEVTLKLDGTSFTCYYNNEDFGVCSRNLELLPDENSVYWKMVAKYKIDEKLKILKRNVAIQGEILGEGIQNNLDKIKARELYVFDVWDIDAQRHLTTYERMDFMQHFNSALPQPNNEIGLDIPFYLSMVPVVKGIDVFKNLSEFSTIQDILGFADGPSINCDYREGIVFKSKELVNGEVISFKVISNEYLCKEKD